MFQTTSVVWQLPNACGRNLQQVCNCPSLSVSGGILWLRLRAALLQVLGPCFIVTAWNKRVPTRLMHWERVDLTLLLAIEQRPGVTKGMVYGFGFHFKNKCTWKVVGMGLTMRDLKQMKILSVVQQFFLKYAQTKQHLSSCILYYRHLLDIHNVQ